MTAIDFYHLTRTSLDEALPRLLAKVLEGGLRAVVRLADEEGVTRLDRALWTAERASFLPHGMAGDPAPERQPIWLTTGEDNPNGAGLLAVAEGGMGGLEAFARVLVLFDGQDDAALAQARGHWKRCRDAGHTLVYRQQDEAGGWRAHGAEEA